MARSILENVEFKKFLDGFVFLGGFQAVAGGTGCAALDERINDLAPSSACRLGVGVAQVCYADLVGAVHILDCIIEAMEHLHGGSAVRGPEADSFSLVVLRVEDLGGFSLE